jgi:hypothetical protein
MPPDGAWFSLRIGGTRFCLDAVEWDDDGWPRRYVTWRGRQGQKCEMLLSGRELRGLLRDGWQDAEEK